MCTRSGKCEATRTRTVVNPASCSSASMLTASEKYTSRYGSVLRKMEKSIWTQACKRTPRKLSRAKKAAFVCVRV